MRITFIIFILLLLCFTKSFSQANKTQPAAKPAPPKPLLKDLRDSASYAAGIFVVNIYRQQEVRNLNSAMVARAINDLQSGKPVMLNEESANKCIQDYQQQLKQPKPTTVKPATAPKNAVLKNLRDSASYAAGIFVAGFYHSNGITNINSAICTRAINDLQTNNKSILNEKQANDAVIGYLNKLQREKAKPRIDAGEKFLAENKTRPGVITTASGLQYEIISQGTGPMPTRDDQVTCNYRGYYIDGNEFDNSYKRGAPATFSVTRVIAGWTEALQMMPVGSKWKLYIPYQLGYGPADYQSIPGGSTLLFEIELLSIVPK